MIASWTAVQIREAIRHRHISAEEVVQTFLDRITECDGRLNAWLTVAADSALAEARAIDRTRPDPVARPLLGVPVAIKDNLCTRGVPTSAGSRVLQHFVPPFDATVVSRLRAAGAIVLGKTNCDEFAMGSSNENSAFGPVRNPWALDRIPGGSSGGSAAAVAARMAPVALGSDTGGSVRLPAALCGVVGLKPTYGRVSRFGLIAFGSSLDQVGPLARTVDDAAALLTAISGHDPRDATSAPREPAGMPDAEASLVGLRVGVPRRFMAEGVDERVSRIFETTLGHLQTAGASLVEIDLPHAPTAIPTYYIVATAEASSNLARYDGVRYGYRAALSADDGLVRMYEKTRDQGFGAEVKRRIMLGTYVLSAGYYDAYYLKAQQVRTLIRQDYERAFAGSDVIAMPTSPGPAFALGERVDDPLQMYLADVFTVSANLAGLPAVSIPAGFTPEGLPVGFQLTGAAFDESRLLGISRVLEGLVDAGSKEPPGFETIRQPGAEAGA